MTHDNQAHRRKTLSRHHLVTLYLIVMVAFGLRLYAFAHNTRAYGDVNTMSISAQQLLMTGHLQYPWRIDRYEDKLGDPLASPAYQHAPLYPLTAAFIARALGTTDTFFTLKLLSLVMGMALVLVAVWSTSHHISPRAGLIAGLLIAISPALIDFSGNGSPYIGSALALLLFTHQLAAYRFRPSQTTLLALTCSVGFQLHPAMLVLTGCAVLYGLFTVRKSSITHVMIFGFIWLLCYLPTALWYLTYYDKPFISGQWFFVAGELGLTGRERDAVAFNPILLLTHPLYEHYFGMMRVRADVYLANLSFEVGVPFLIAALATGIIGLYHRQRLFIHLIAPRLLYLIMSAAAMSLFHIRFLIPVLPALFIMAASGFDWMAQVNQHTRRIATLFLCLYALGALTSYFTPDTPTARYYRDVSLINFIYDAARDIAEQLRHHPAATIAGCSDARMMLYGTPFRLEATSCSPSIRRLDELQRYPDLNIRYLFYRRPVIQTLHTYYPSARIIAQNDVFAVIDLSPAPES